MTVRLLDEGRATVYRELNTQHVLVRVRMTMDSQQRRRIVTVLSDLIYRFNTAPGRRNNVLKRVSNGRLIPARRLSTVLIRRLTRIKGRVDLRSVRIISTRLLRLLLTRNAATP